MTPLPVAAAALALLAARALAVDARDIPAAEWDCPPATDRASLGVSFKTAPVQKGPVVDCGTEVLWNTSTSDGKKSMPTFYFPAADLNAVYTLIVVDRDILRLAATGRADDIARTQGGAGPFGPRHDGVVDCDGDTGLAVIDRLGGQQL